MSQTINTLAAVSMARRSAANAVSGAAARMPGASQPPQSTAARMADRFLKGLAGGAAAVGGARLLAGSGPKASETLAAARDGVTRVLGAAASQAHAYVPWSDAAIPGMDGYDSGLANTHGRSAQEGPSLG